NGPGLVHGFLPFEGWHAIRHDPAAGLDVELAVLDHGGADGDGGVHVAVPANVAHGAAVDTALDRLQLIDDLHGANLGSATQGPGGQGGAQHIDGADPGAHLAGDVGGDVHLVGKALHGLVFRHLDRADAGHPAHIVAAQVDEHQVLGDLLGIGQHLALHRQVLLLGVAAATGPGDGAHRHL